MTFTCKDCKYYFLEEIRSHEFVGIFQTKLECIEKEFDRCQVNPGNPIDLSNREGLKPCKEFKEKE